MSKNFLLLILLLLSIPLIIIAKEKGVDDAIFSPGGHMYIFKEWSRDLGLLAIPDPEERMLFSARICTDKLKEIGQSARTDEAIANYSTELKNLDLYSSSLREISDKETVREILEMAFFHKEFISASITIPDKDILAESSFRILTGIVFSVSDRAVLANIIEEHAMVQSTLVDGIKDIDEMIPCSRDEVFSREMIDIEMEIMRKISPDNLSQSDLSFLNNKVKEIRNSAWYTEKLHTEQSSVYQGMRSAFSSGSWLDGIVDTVTPEEYDALISFRSSLSGIDPDNADQRIDVLEVYEETRTAIKEAKNALVSSFVYEQEKFPFENHETISTKTGKDESENPASAYCTRNGYTIVEIEKDGEIIRNCVIDENNVCEEWTFYRGECKIKEETKK